MNFTESIEFLDKYADMDNCEGDCDESPPYRKCPECLACHALNEVGEVLDNAVREIEKMEREGKENLV